MHDQLYFSDSETTSNSSKRGKRRIKKIYKHKPVHLYNWNQPSRHIDHYILTVIKRKKELHSKRRKSRRRNNFSLCYKFTQ